MAGLLDLLKGPQQSSAALDYQAKANAQLYPGLSSLQATGAAQAMDQEAAAKAQTVQEISGLIQEGSPEAYIKAAARYAQIDPEGAKSLIPQLMQANPQLQQMLSFGQESGSLGARIATGNDPRSLKLLDMQAERAREKSQKSVEAPKLTVGEENLDKAFVKDLAEGLNTGLFAQAEKSLSNLKVAKDLLSEGKGTGTFTGLLPTEAQDVVNPEMSVVRDNIRDVITKNLRASLGAQFTEKEGERLLAATFNPRLSPKENLRRVSALETAMREELNNKKKAIEYYQKNGTLKGFNLASTFSQDTTQVIDNIKNRINEQAGPKKGQVVDGYEFLGGNPADKNSWRKK